MELPEGWTRTQLYAFLRKQGVPLWSKESMQLPELPDPPGLDDMMDRRPSELRTQVKALMLTIDALFNEVKELRAKLDQAGS